MNKHNEILIFCQAPADIPYLLTLYERQNEHNNISIFVINVEKTFQYLKELELELKQLIFIPYNHYTLKSIIQITREKRRISRLIKKHFSIIANTEVYFFSRFEDWLTSAFINTLAKNKSNTINYVDHYDFSAEVFNRRTFSIKAFVLKYILFFITKVKFRVEVLEKLPEFRVEKYAIQIRNVKINPIVFSKYCFNISPPEKNPIVLLFVSPSIDSLYNTINYDYIQYKTIAFLKRQGWTIAVKGHPRLGVPENILPLVDILVPSHIPAEFIGGENIKLCLGILSNAISNFAKHSGVSTYSMLYLFKFKKEEKYAQYEKYLSKSSDYKLGYFANMEIFKQMTDRIKGES